MIRFDKIPYENLTLSEFQDGIKYIQTIDIESIIQLKNDFKKQGNNCLTNNSVEIDFEGCLENLFGLNDSDLYENREMFIFRSEPEEQKVEMGNVFCDKVDYFQAHNDCPDDLDFLNENCNEIQDSSNFIEGLRSIIDSVSHLSEEEKNVFIERMSRFEKLFTQKYESADTFEYELKIKPHKTYIRRNYPIPCKHREPVGKQMKKMLDLNIIERADCSYCSPLRIVIKDDGTVRICLDARFINEIIEDDHESPPLINELLQKYYGVTFISTTDLATGYWQIPLHPNSRKYTAFVYDSKVYQFCRLPFGLKTAGSAFICALNFALGDKFRDVLSMYIDDFLIATRGSFYDHLHALEGIFDVLQKKNFTLKLSKSLF